MTQAARTASIPHGDGHEGLPEGQGFTRLFLALWPGPAARFALAAWCERWQWPPGAVVVPAARLHLTLHFIGPVPTARLPELARALAVPCPRFDIVLGHADLWPRGVAVLCAHDTPEPLADLHARLGLALARLGLPPDERALRPHVTLARKAAHATMPPEPLHLRWRVTGYALVQSRGGYHSVAQFRS